MCVINRNGLSKLNTFDQKDSIYFKLSKWMESVEDPENRICVSLKLKAKSRGDHISESAKTFTLSTPFQCNLTENVQICFKPSNHK